MGIYYIFLYVINYYYLVYTINHRHGTARNSNADVHLFEDKWFYLS
jgi:hypothetical protein